MSREYRDDAIKGVMVIAVIVCIIVGFATYSLTSQWTDDSWKKQIVQHKCAEFYLDADNNRQWRWK